MELSYELISQFAKQVAKSNNKNVSESTVYGTVKVDANGNKYVMLDGSDQLTPLADDERPTVDSTSANANDGERVSVLIKNHTATVTGNISSPAARTGDVEKLEDSVSKIQEFDILIGEQIQAQEGYIKALQTDKANVGDLNAATAKITELETNKASIEELNAAKAKITDLDATKIDADVVNATFATIESLNATNANISNLNTDYVAFKNATGDQITAIDGKFTNLNTEYANIDFANIGEAAIRKIFSDTGMIKDLVVGDQSITGELIGVTIKGDLIEGETIVADKIVVRGDDGLYYKLNVDGETIEAEQTDYNSLNGSIITAKSITAGKVNVDDLVAFDATIGGFQITEKAIHSVTKTSVDNTLPGVYLDSDGQFAVGNDDNYIRYNKDENGIFDLQISASSIDLQIQNTTDPLVETIDKVNKHFSFTDDGLVISNGPNTMSLRVDNDIISFEKDGIMFGWWDGVDFHTGNLKIELTQRAQFGNFAFVPRSDGSLSFLKVENTEGFYTRLYSGTLVLYGSYPTATDNTLTFTDIPGTLENTTLKLGGE